MNVAQEIIHALTLHVEAEIQGKRRLAALDADVVAAFLAISNTPPSVTSAPPPDAPQPITPTRHAQPAPKIEVSEKKYPSLIEFEQALRASIPAGDAETLSIGEGNTSAPDFMFVMGTPEIKGDAAEELLTNMIAAMGYHRDQIYVTSLIKQHLPKGHRPTAAEIAEGGAWLDNQIDLIQPKCMITLGPGALRHLAQSPRLDLARVHGIWHKYRNVPFLPTFNPAHLKQFPNTKKDAWNDLKIVLKFLGKTPPAPKRRS